MSTYRVKKDKGYFVANNLPFNDRRLSWEASGVMGYLLSKPDGWKCRNNDLINQRNAGNDKVNRILKELKYCGYFYRHRVHDEEGKFEWVTNVYENPSDNPDVNGLMLLLELLISLSSIGVKPIDGRSGAIGVKPIDGQTFDGQTFDGKGHYIVSTESISTESINTNEIKKHEQNVSEKQIAPSLPPKPTFPSSFDSQVSHTSKTILYQPIVFKDKNGKIIHAMVVGQTPKQLKVATMSGDKFTLRASRDKDIAYLNGKVAQVVWAGPEPEKESDPVVQIFNDLKQVIDEAIIATSTEAEFSKIKNYAIRASKGNVLKPGQVLEFKHWYYDVDSQWQAEKNPITIYTIQKLIGKYNNWLKSGKKPYTQNKKDAQPSRNLITRGDGVKSPPSTITFDNKKRDAEIAALVAAGVQFTDDSVFD